MGDDYCGTGVVGEERYGVRVWLDKEMDELRKTRCLCLRCLRLGDCAESRKLLRFCIEHDVGLAVTRCPSWRAQREVHGLRSPVHRMKTWPEFFQEVGLGQKRFEVRIVEDPDQLATSVMFDYDVVLLHLKNYKPLTRGDQAKANLVRFVTQGKGLVLLHFASGAFEDWPQFADLAGMVWDRKGSHDPRGPFAVRIVGADHPITKGMESFQADDELYTCLVGDRRVDLLAVAHSKVTGRDHPMAFAFARGKGRVFHTTLGHDAKAIRVPGTARLIRRGCAWAAGRNP